MGQEDNFVTMEKCEAYRKEYVGHNHDQDISIAELQTDVGFVKTILYAILGTLISGFAGTIFTLLKVMG